LSKKDISDLQVVKAYKQCRNENLSRWPYEILQEITGQCEKVCLSAMERSYNRGYIDYGVSLRSGWVTGNKLVEDKEESK
jgi:hypothetical protein